MLFVYQSLNLHPGDHVILFNTFIMSYAVTTDRQVYIIDRVLKSKIKHSQILYILLNC